MSPTLHVIFKTHLDLGFTGAASAVRAQYHDHYIPMALDTAEHFLREDSANPGFIWTTGAWLIWDHLQTQAPDKVRRLERAIAAGAIRWHALPFTTHSELMSARMMREGIGIARDLDGRFGLTTRTAKMTDVPGHTLGAAQVMADEGIEFLHLGVNTACPVPDVPPVFTWATPGGARLTVMYQGSYGGTMVPPGATEGIAFAHTNDNTGPQGVPQVIENMRHIARESPGLRPRASTLEAFWDGLRPLRDTLPVVTEEIGDTWIHGIGSAPARVRRYLAAQRALDGWEMTPPRRACARKLTEVAEHTWGVDIKTHLRDESVWTPQALALARATDPRFQLTEASWAEQDAIVDAALALLDPADRNAAAPRAAPVPPKAGWGPVPDHNLPLGELELTFRPGDGSIARVSRGGQILLAARPGSAGLFAFTQEGYDAADLARSLDSYLTARPEWADLDHGKPGLAAEPSQWSGSHVPAGAQVAADGPRLWTRARLPATAQDRQGAPACVLTCVEATDSGLRITLLLQGKRAYRQPEAGFWHLDPVLTLGTLRLTKMGLTIDPRNVVSGGNRQLHAVEAVSFAGTEGSICTVRPQDAPLFALGPFLPFTRALPMPDRGGRFVLFNNKWGTNFSMWCEGDMTFALDLTFQSA